MTSEDIWLLTLPETGKGSNYQPACIITAFKHTQEFYYSEEGSEFGKQLLTERTCTISLHWQNEFRQYHQDFKATFSVDFITRKTILDLTNSDFILDTYLRGRGLGSWIMRQLVIWAGTLPSDTMVKSIRISPVDEEDPINLVRRNRFWQGIGFRFKDGGRVSLPLTLEGLKQPVGRQGTLECVPLIDGLGELLRSHSQLSADLVRTEMIRKNLASENARLEDRQWNVLITNIVIRTVFSPFYLISFIHAKIFRKKPGKTD